MKSLTYIYLDWNVFNKIEKLAELSSPEKEIFTILECLIQGERVKVPYSNAHMSDLLRGYLKNPNFISGHLQTLSRLTANLCITQYWGEPKAKWHYRLPAEFFDSTIEDNESTAQSFSSLFDEFDDPLMRLAGDLQKEALRRRTIDSSFKKIYSFDPFFSTMFPKTKIEMNQLALCEDLFSFSLKIKSDYALYKNYRKVLNNLRIRLPEYQKLYSQLQNKVIGIPKALNWDELWETADLGRKESSNPAYDKVINLFTTTDLKGYRQDEKFANLIDDALHCFYGAHCQYFVTLDSRCYDKAKKVYEKLDIITIVTTPEELVKQLGQEEFFL